MICTTNMFTLSIDPRECIGASLPKINQNFDNLARAVCELSSVSIIPYDSDTIDISYDPVTRILSADVIENGHITDAMLSAMPPFTVKGNKNLFPSTPQNIPAGDCTVLGRYSGSTAPLEFHKIINCQITPRTIESDRLVLKTIQNDVIGDDQIDNRTLSAMPPYSVKGNATNNPNADPQDIAAAPYTALVRPNPTDDLVWTPAASDSALIRTATNSLSFVNSPQDSVLMRDQTDLRFVTAPGYSAYLKENGTVPLGFSVAGPDTALYRSDVTDNLSFKYAPTDTVFLRDNTHLQFAPVPENSVIARDEQHVRAISAAPFSAFIRPGVSNSPDDRLQFRVAEANSALIRTNTLNLSFAVAPTNTALLRDNGDLRHVPAGTNTALVRTDIGTATQSLSFIPAPERTVLLRKNNDDVEFEKIEYDMFADKIGTVAEGTIVMWYPTQSTRPITHYFDTDGLGRPDKEYDGWAICNGNSYTITYAAGGTEVFTTPDLRSKFTVGAQWSGPGLGRPTNWSIGALTTYNVKDEGGWEKHHLSIPELPKHVHNISSVDPGHVHTYQLNKKKRIDATWHNEDGASPNGGGKTATTKSSKTNIKDTAPTGNDLSHENRPPYYALYYIIKLVSGRMNKEWFKGAVAPPGPGPTPMPTTTPVPTPVPAPLGYVTMWQNGAGGTYATGSLISTPANVNTFMNVTNDILYYATAQLALPSKLVMTSISYGGDVSLQNMTGLTEVDLSSTGISTLNCTGSPAIQILDVSNCNLTTLTVTPFQGALKQLLCGNNNITTLNLNGCGALQVLDCSNTATLGTLTLPGATVLQEVNASSTGITNITLTNATSLKKIDFSDNNSINPTLDISGCSNLESLVALDTNFSNGTTLIYNAATFTKLKSISLNADMLAPGKIVDILNKLTVTGGALSFNISSTADYPAGLSGTAGYAGAKANAVAKGWTVTPALP